MYFETRNFSVFSRFSSEMKRTFTQPLFAKETNRTVEGCVSLTKSNLNLIVNKENGYFTVRLTVRVDHTHPPPPPHHHHTHDTHTSFSQLFVILLVCAKKQVFLGQKHCFKPFLVVKMFTFAYGQPERKISAFCFDDFPKTHLNH